MTSNLQAGTRRDALVVACIGGLAFAASAIYAVTLSHYFVMPDELVYAKGAIQIWHSPPLVPQGSDWFVSWSQLLPLLDAIPLGASSSMVSGLWIAHLVGAAAMSLTVLPAFLLAREVTLDRRAGYLVAALCIAVPWIAMTGALMTEVVAYPAFTWAAYATVRACTRPGPRSDLLVLAASAVTVFARSQLAFVPVVAAILVLLCAVRARRSLRVHRVMVTGIGLGIAALLVRLAISGNISGLLGSYAVALSHSGGFSINPATKVFTYVGVTVGLAPVAIGIPWLLTRLVRPARDAEFAFALFALTTVVFVFVQSGLDRTQPARVEDRFLIYALPLLFTALAAALVSARGLVRWTALAGALFALLASQYDFFEVGADITSLSFTIHGTIIGLTGRTGIDPGLFVAVIAALVTALLAIAMGQEPGHRRLYLVGLGVLAFGAMQTGMAFSQVHRSRPAFGYVELPPRTWIDDALPSGASAGMIVGSTGAELTTPLYWWSAGFWNRKATRYYLPAALGPSAPRYYQPSVRALALSVGGRPLARHNWWVVSTRDRAITVSGGRVIATHGSLELLRSVPGSPIRLRVHASPSAP